MDEGMTSALPPRPGLAAFPPSGFAALVAAAARECPDLVLLSDDSGTSTAADVARRVGRLAALLRHAGFAPGERVLVVAGATTASVVALVAVLRAELEPALVPVGLGPVELVAHARAANAVALIGPSRYGAAECGEAYLTAAALSDSIRMIATQGPGPVDGAVDISFDRLDAMVAVDDTPATGEPGTITTFAGPPTAPILVAHRQVALFADALSLVEQARINPSARIISLLPPASLAGLVAGPCAALIGASSLALHGPFEAARFLAACDAEPGFHIVAPAAIGPAFEDGALTVDASSLILVSRFADPGTFALPDGLDCDRPIVDLYAYGEDTLLAQRRQDGRAQPPARVTDKSAAGGLGARLNRARAEHRLHGAEG